MAGNSASASLLQNHEQQYGAICADITSKIGQLSSVPGNERKNFCNDIEKLIEDGQELMEQMELESRDIALSLRPKYVHRISSYNAELSRLKQDFSKVKYRSHADLPASTTGLYAEYNSDLNSEQRQRLLDTTEQIEETGKHLANGYRIAVETEELGAKILHDLYGQKETIQNSLNRVHETNTNVQMSSQVLTGMAHRSIQHRLILVGICGLFLMILILTVYKI